MANKTMQAPGTRIDVAPLVGTWFGVKLDENRIARIQITEEDDTLFIHPYGSDAELSDWGPAEATPYVASGSTTASGFQAQCQVGAMRVEFFTVENQGVLLVQTFTSFHDGSGRAGEFGKAYYRRAPAELVAADAISTGATTGEWVNANPATSWVAGFTLTEDAGTTTIRIRGASDPIDWGAAEVTTCQDRHGEHNFCVAYDLEPFTAMVGVISIKNLVVLNVFRRLKDSESLPTFCREFFFRNS